MQVKGPGISTGFSLDAKLPPLTESIIPFPAAAQYVWGEEGKKGKWGEGEWR